MFRLSIGLLKSPQGTSCCRVGRNLIGKDLLYFVQLPRLELLKLLKQRAGTIPLTGEGYPKHYSGEDSRGGNALSIDSYAQRKQGVSISLLDQLWEHMVVQNPQLISELHAALFIAPVDGLDVRLRGFGISMGQTMKHYPQICRCSGGLWIFCILHHPAIFLLSLLESSLPME